MHPVQKHLFDTNFKGLSGTRIEGTIALSDELINLGVMDFLSRLKSGTDNSAGDELPKVSAAAPSENPDPMQLLSILDVEMLKFQSEEGRIFVSVAAGIK